MSLIIKETQIQTTWQNGSEEETPSFVEDVEQLLSGVEIGKTTLENC